MKKATFVICALATSASLLACYADPKTFPQNLSDTIENLANTIPEIEYQSNPNYTKIENVAQYGEADWSNVIGIAKNISVTDAASIADANPDVTYFFYVKGFRMGLNNGNGMYIFNHGDAVFFSGSPWWGSAPNLADGYIKNIQ
ncbi:MAG: hypothetical protein WCG42_01490 [Parachlamydiaceae bacterium]